MLWYQSSGAYLHYTNINRGVHPLALKCPKVRRCRRCGAKHAARLATLVSRLPLHRAHRRTCVEQNSQVPPVFPGRIWHRCWFCHEVSILVWQPTRINCGCGVCENHTRHGDSGFVARASHTMPDQASPAAALADVLRRRIDCTFG